MSRYLAAAMMVGCVCALGMTCEGDGGFDLGVARWGQFQGDSLKQGFMVGRTSYALQPLLKWELDVGEVSYSSPVQGPDGTIYIGTKNGALVAVNPDGTEKWTQPFFDNLTAFGAPAVADDGNIFFVTSEQIPDGRVFSRLHKISPTGEILGSALPNTAMTTASPTLWNDLIFLPAYTNNARAELFVFDTNLNEVAREERINICTPICGSSAIVDLIGDILAVWADCLFPPPCGYDGGGVDFVGTYMDSSVAVFDDGSESPIIVVATPFCMNAYVFDGPNDLTFLWNRTVYGGDCGDKPNPHSTPAILNGGMLVIGDKAGIVRAYDVTSGMELWDYDAGEAILAPAASFGRQIYIASKETVHLLDANGTFLAKYPVAALTQAAPVLSSEFAYVSAENGIHTFTFDLLSGYTKDGTFEGGLSSPAILDDGTLLVASRDGRLRAYDANGSLNRSIPYPTVRFDESTDDAPISYANASALAVEVTDPIDGMFEGEVVFHSNQEGQLCVKQGAGNAFTCSTMNLSIGTHVLTAAATNAMGGTGTASITVEVVNTPPTLELISPVAGNEYFDHQPIAFEAYVFDPEQLPFPESAVRWSSSIDGDLGTGWTISKKLSAGFHQISVSAVDEMGDGVVTTTLIDIKSGAGKPTAEILSPANDEFVAPNTMLTFAATVSDPEDGALPADQIEWISDFDGLLGTGKTVQAALSASADPCNHRRHTITLRLTDSHGNVTEYTFEVVVGVIC